MKDKPRTKIKSKATQATNSINRTGSDKKSKSAVKAKARTRTKANPCPGSSAKTKPASRQSLLLQIRKLETRLLEHEEMLRAVRKSEPDTLKASSVEGDKIFTLKGANKIYRIIIETMREGALLLSSSGNIIFTNRRVAEITGLPGKKLINSPFSRFVIRSDRTDFKSVFNAGRKKESIGYISLCDRKGSVLAVRISCMPFSVNGKPCVCAVVTDISETRKYLDIIESGRLAQTVIEQAESCIIVCDTLGKIIQANNSTYRYCSGKIVLQYLDDVLELYHTNRDPGTRTLFSIARVLNGKRFNKEEMTLKTVSGETFYLIMNAQPLSDEHQNIIGCLIMLTDITAQNQAEQALRENEALLRTITDNSPDPIFMKDRDSRVTFANPAMLALIGKPAEAVLGKTDEEFYDDPETGRAIMENDRRIIDSGRIEAVEETIDYPDGRRIFLSTKAPYLDANGTITGLIGIARDITERKLAEENLRQSEKRWRQLAEAMPQLVWTCTPEGFCDYLSSQWVSYTGISEEQQLGYAWLEQVHADDREPLMAAWNNASLSGCNFDVEFRIRRHDGPYRWFKTRAVPVRDKAGNIVKWYGSNTDINDLRESETRFRLLSETSSRLLQAENPQVIIEELCTKVMQYLDCQTFFNFMSDETIGRLHLNACAGIPEEEVKNIEWLDYGVAVCGCVAAEGQRIVAEDIFHSGDPRTELVKSYGIQAYACHPLLGTGERVLGTLSFGTRNRASFSVDDLDLMKTVADQVAIAMERIRLINKARRRADEAEEGRNLLNTLMENIPIGITIADAPDGRIRMVSRYGMELLGAPHSGMTVGEVTSRWAVYDPSGMTPVPDDELPLVRALSKGETVENRELMQVSSSGKRLVLSCNAAPLRNADGDITGGIVAWADITERRKNDEERARLASFPLRNPQPIVEVDLQGTVQFVNPAVRRLFPDIEQKGAEHAFLKDFSLISDKCRETDSAFFSREIKADGCWYYQIILHIPETQQIRFYSIDISDRKYAEEALVEARAEAIHEKNLLEAVMDAIPVGVAVTDLQGGTIRSNHTFEQLWGGPRPETRSLSDYVAYRATWVENGQPVQPDEWASALVVKNGEPVIGQLLAIECFDGRQRYVLNSAAPFMDADGRIAGSAVAVQDISDRILAENALQQARDELELRVQERTAELALANRSLQQEILERQRAHELVVKQSRLLEAFFNHSVTPLVFLDNKFNFIRVNQAYARACQRDIEEFQGRNHFDLYPGEETRMIFEQVVATGEVFEAIARPFVFSDHPEWGVTYWDWILTPLVDENGEVETLVFSLRDVTERIRAEEQIRTQAELLELANDAIVIRDMDDNIIFWNRGAEYTYGWSKEEALGAIVHHLLKTRYPISQQEIKAAVLQSGHWEGELVHQTHQGAEIIVESRWSLQRNQHGGPVAIFQINRDITERKNAENALRLSEQLLKNSQQIAHLGSWEWDMLSGAQTWSDEMYRIFGYEPQAITMTHEISMQAIHPEDKQYVMQAVQRALDRQNSYSIDFRIIRQDGAVRHVNSQAEIYRNEHGNPVRMAGSVLDITDRKNIEKELQKTGEQLRYLSAQLLTAQELERKRIAGEVHDELGQAMTVLKLRLRTIEKHLRQDQVKLKGECLDLLGYTDGILKSVRRICRDLTPTVLEDLGLSSAVRWLVDNISQSTDFKIELQMDNIDAMVEKELQINVYRILQECLNNCVKHAGARRVTVSIRDMQGGFVMRVEDDGQGFNHDQLAASNADRKGVGISTMRERALLLRGTLDIASSEDAGTCVTLQVPGVMRGELYHE